MWLKTDGHVFCCSCVGVLPRCQVSGLLHWPCRWCERFASPCVRKQWEQGADLHCCLQNMRCVAWMWNFTKQYKYACVSCIDFAFQSRLYTNICHCVSQVTSMLQFNSPNNVGVQTVLDLKVKLQSQNAAWIVLQKIPRNVEIPTEILSIPPDILVRSIMGTVL